MVLNLIKRAWIPLSLIACLLIGFTAGQELEKRTIASRMFREITDHVVFANKTDQKGLIDIWTRTVVNVGRRSDYLEHGCRQYSEFHMP